MTNSWAMLFDYVYGSSDEELMNIEASENILGAAGKDFIASPYDSGFETASPEEFSRAVVITEQPEKEVKHTKDVTFWKYNEGKILREVEQYLSGTYKGHYVGAETKVQTLDLIDSIGDAEAFCRSNAIKYLSRFGKKDGKNPKDLLKVIHYAMLLYHFSELPFTEDAKETFSPMGR